MIQYLTNKRDEEGFTLIELLVVIVILGILAAVVVFAVGGLADKGQSDACKTDTRTLRTAEEAYYAKNGTYVDETTLSSTGTPKFLAQASTYHDITPPTTGGYAAGYIITVQDSKCGTPGGAVGTGSNV